MVGSISYQSKSYVLKISLLSVAYGTFLRTYWLDFRRLKPTIGSWMITVFHSNNFLVGLGYLIKLIWRRDNHQGSWWRRQIMIHFPKSRRRTFIRWRLSQLLLLWTTIICLTVELKSNSFAAQRKIPWWFMETGARIILWNLKCISASVDV